MQFRGRTEEQALLSVRLSEAASGIGGLVTVEGGPGVGKTRLLAEVAALARASGFTVATCAVGAGPAATPARALAPLGAGDAVLLEPDDLDALATRPDRRFLLLDRLRANLAERARRDPIVVIVDDAQWADPATLLVLRALTPPGGTAHYLCIVARRPAPVSLELARALSVFHARGGTRLRLGPLAPSAVAAMVEDATAARPDPALCELVAGAAGNPRYVTELLRGLAEEDAVDVRAGTARLVRGSLPARLRDAVHADLLAVSPDARDFLANAAIFGRTFSLRDVATLLECPGGRLLPVAHEALRSGFLVDEPPRLTFPHALVSDVLYDSLGDERRRRLPQEAALALSAHHPPGMTALQFAARARKGDRRAIALLSGAADDVARRSPSAAADILVRVVELLPPGDPERVSAGERACSMLAGAGRGADLDRLSADLLAGRPPLPGDAILHVRRVQALVLTGRHAAAIDRAYGRPAAAVPPGPVRVQLLAAAATARAAVGEVGAAERAAAAVVGEAEATGQDDVVVGGLCALSRIELRRGRLRVARAAAAEAVRRADAGSIRARRRHPRLALAQVLAALDHLDEAERALVAVRQEVAEYGSAWALAPARALRAALLLARGRLTGAAEEAGAAVIAARDGAAGSVEAQALLLLVRASRYARATEAVTSAARAARRLSAAGVAGPQLERALALADGSFAAALPLELLAEDPTSGPLAVRAALRAGDVELAARIAADAAELARLSPGVPSIAGCGRHAEGLVRNDAEGLRRAVEILRTGPRPLPLAAALEDLGLALDPEEDREAAILAFEEALLLYGTSGATFGAVQVRRELRALGARGRYRVAEQGDGGGWDSLTRAERAVAQLVADGLSNRRVAARLFVSSSTVDTHVQHIFGKLGINSRVQLARMVAVQAAAS